MVQMGRFAGRRPAQLSGGQQQRVALARALVFEPELVLMDEPLGALDKQLREHMQYEIKHLHERLGVTVVYVTHDQCEALTMSDRIAVFNDGQHPAARPPEDLYERPENAFVARFIGENNRLFGTVDAVEGGFATVKLEDGTPAARSRSAAATLGARTQLSIRPGAGEVGGKAGENRVEAKVLELIYHGDHIRCRMEVHGNDTSSSRCRTTAPARR